MRLLLALFLIGAVIYFFYGGKYRQITGDTTVTSDTEVRRSSEGPMEEAGRAVDRALNKAGAAVEDLGETIQKKTSPAITPHHP